MSSWVSARLRSHRSLNRPVLIMRAPESAKNDLHPLTQSTEESPSKAFALLYNIIRRNKSVKYFAGLGVFFAGIFGSCVGVTTYSENIGVINVTKVRD